MKSEDQPHDSEFLPDQQLNPTEVPPGVDRRAFMMRSALVGAMSVITGCSPSTPEQATTPQAVSAMALTAKEMNSKYKEPSEGGLAVSVTLC
jgi:predicted component of type VI protein secretion system